MEFPGLQKLVLSANRAKLPYNIPLEVSLASLQSKCREYDLFVKKSELTKGH
jgi:hypothetical protein